MINYYSGETGKKARKRNTSKLVPIKDNFLFNDYVLIIKSYIGKYLRDITFSNTEV